MYSLTFFNQIRKKNKIPSGTVQEHEATSNIIFNLSQMGISLSEASSIELDTYFELLDLYGESMSAKPKNRMASQMDIERFLL